MQTLHQETPNRTDLMHRVLRGCGMRAVEPEAVTGGRGLSDLSDDELAHVGTLLVSGRTLPMNPARAAMLAEERAARLQRALEAIQADAVDIVTHVHTAGHVHELAKRIVRTTSEAMV